MNSEDGSEATATSKASDGASSGSITPSTPELWQRTAVAAFFLAQARGFAPGHELDDWLAAERQVNESVRPSVGAAARQTTTGSADEKNVPKRRPRKSVSKPDTTGVEPLSKKKTGSARKAAARTRRTKPGIEAELGGIE